MVGTLGLIVQPRNADKEPAPGAVRQARAHEAALRAAADDLRSFLEVVRDWAIANSTRIARVYFAVESDGYRLFVCPRSKGYDATLTDALSAFLIALADEGYNIQGSQIPDGTPEELAAFFDPRHVFFLSAA